MLENMVPAVTRLCSFVESDELCRKQESEKTQRANRTKRQRKLSRQRVDCRKVSFFNEIRETAKKRENRNREIKIAKDSFSKYSSLIRQAKTIDSLSRYRLETRFIQIKPPTD